MRTLSLIVLAACGGTPSPAPEAAAAPARAFTGIPDGADSRAFAEKLVDLQIANFRPTDADGASLVYTSLRFAPDATWSASGSISSADESISCTETGSWVMDPATNASVGTVTWTIASTDCAGRASGLATRAEFTIAGDGTFTTKFR